MHVACMNHACSMNGIHAMNVPCMNNACMIWLLNKHSAVFKFLVQKPACKKHKLKIILGSQQIHSAMHTQQLASEAIALYMLHKHQLASELTALHKTSQLPKSQYYMYTHCTSYPVAQLVVPAYVKYGGRLLPMLKEKLTTLLERWRATTAPSAFPAGDVLLNMKGFTPKACLASLLTRIKSPAPIYWRFAC